MKESIIKLCMEQNISDVGFCSVSEYDKNAKMLMKTPYFGKILKSPKETVEGAKTIVVCAFNYFNGAKKGNLSRYAMGADYHGVVTNKMRYIADFLKEKGYKAEMFADTGYLNERLLAKLSGIAFLGKNQMAISPKFGSYFFIGYIVTDCEMEFDVSNNQTCLNCGRCETVCPLKALDNGFEQTKCLSYITQKKGNLTEEEQNAMIASNTVWGCDLCQEVCPHNRNIPVTEIREFKENLITTLDIDFDISNKKFSELYKNRAFSWRGKGVIIRNLEVLKKNKKF